MVTLNCILGFLGTFIEDFFNWSMNSQHHHTGFCLLVVLILIRCCPRMLSKLVCQFRILTCLIVHNIQLIYIGNIGSGICFFKFKYCFFSSVTLQWSPCSFFPNLMNYIYIEFSFQQFTFWLSLYIHTYLCPYLLPYKYLTKVKIFSGNNHQSKAT